MERRDLNRDAIAVASRRRLLALCLHWLLRPLGYLECTDVFTIQLAALPPLFEVPGYEIEPAGADEVAEITRNITRDEPPAVLEALWAGGHHCFVAKFNGRVVAYNWIAFSAVQEEEYRYEPRPEHAICVDAYTVAEHRGKGLHYLLLLTMLHFAATSGRTMAYTGASLFNVVSWKTHLRMGWRREFTFCWFKPYFTLKRFPWRLTKEQYPLRLDWSRHAWFAASKDEPVRSPLSPR
ncbi:MAG TPA: GNAT family N-acetyltransferase [Sphingomicrobium sp.]|nr:GNAT family N-acetyltransferase [Sphingomicrobium sp.]